MPANIYIIYNMYKYRIPLICRPLLGEVIVKILYEVSLTVGGGKTTAFVVIFWVGSPPPKKEGPSGVAKVVNQHELSHKNCFFCCFLKN